MALEDCREAVSLDRGWDAVTSEFDVLQHDWVETSIIERARRLDLDDTFLHDIDLLNPGKY